MIKVNSGKAKIKDERTGEVYEIDSNGIYFEVVETDPSRPMGSELHHEAEVEHEKLGTFTWNVYEYPVGAKEATLITPEYIKIVEDFYYQFE